MQRTPWECEGCYGFRPRPPPEFDKLEQDWRPTVNDPRHSNWAIIAGQASGPYQPLLATFATVFRPFSNEISMALEFLHNLYQAQRHRGEWATFANISSRDLRAPVCRSLPKGAPEKAF